MSEAKHTKGPWKWLVNKSSKKVELCGSGIEVLRFKRYGMQSATPTFTENYRGHKLQGINAMDLAQEIKGREHHSDWCQTINHPDAYLIEAAPDMLEALLSIENDDGTIPAAIWDLRNKAIAKARGE